MYQGDLVYIQEIGYSPLSWLGNCLQLAQYVNIWNEVFMSEVLNQVLLELITAIQGNCKLVVFDKYFEAQFHLKKYI